MAAMLGLMLVVVLSQPDKIPTVINVLTTKHMIFIYGIAAGGLIVNFAWSYMLKHREQTENFLRKMGYMK